MRPCNKCGVPVVNVELFCDDCAKKCKDPIPVSEATKSPHSNRSVSDDDLSITEQVLLFLFGLAALFGGITSLVVIGLQLVTWFRMPLITSCLIGLGVSLLYSAASIVPQLLMHFTASNKDEDVSN